MAAAADVGLLPALKPVLTDALEAIRWASAAVALERASAGGTLADIAAALPLVAIYVPSVDEPRHQTGPTIAKGSSTATGSTAQRGSSWRNSAAAVHWSQARTATP